MEDFPPLSSMKSLTRSSPSHAIARDSTSTPPSTSDIRTSKPLATPWSSIVKKTAQVTISCHVSSPAAASKAALCSIDPVTGFERALPPGNHPPATPCIPSPNSPASSSLPSSSPPPQETPSHHGVAALSREFAEVAGQEEEDPKQKGVDSMAQAHTPSTPKSDSPASEGEEPLTEEPSAETSREGESLIAVSSEDSSSLLGSGTSSEGALSADSSRSVSPCRFAEVQVAPGVIIRDRGPKIPGKKALAQRGEQFQHGGNSFNGWSRSRELPEQRMNGRGPFTHHSWRDGRSDGRFNPGQQNLPGRFSQGFPPNNFHQRYGFNGNRSFQPSISDTWSRHSRSSHSSVDSLSSQGSLTSVANHGDATQMLTQQACQWYGDIRHRLADVSEWLWASPDRESETQKPTLVAVPVMVPGPDGEVQYIPWIPWDPAALLRAALLHQIEYYFSEQNLCKDVYLRSQMDEEGFVKMSVISKFNKVRCFLVDDTFILDSVKNSEVVEVEGGCIRRRHGWKLWLPVPTSGTPELHPLHSSNSGQSSQFEDESVVYQDSIEGNPNNDTASSVPESPEAGLDGDALQVC